MSYQINKALNLEEVKSNQLVILDFNSLTKAIKEVFKDILIDKTHTPQDHQKNVSDDYLSTDQVKDLLKVSKVTIHNWKKKGLIKSHRIGRRVYFKMDDINSAIKQQKFQF